MSINSLMSFSSLKSRLPITVGSGSIAAFLNRVPRVISENNRRVLTEHTTKNREITLQVQNNKKCALIYRNSIEAKQTNPNATRLFNSHVTLRKVT